MNKRKRKKQLRLKLSKSNRYWKKKLGKKVTFKLATARTFLDVGYVYAPYIPLQFTSFKWFGKTDGKGKKPSNNKRKGKRKR